jgi:hypothetical protein
MARKNAGQRVDLGLLVLKMEEGEKTSGNVLGLWNLKKERILPLEPSK